MRDAGAAAVLLDSVQFPTFTGSADFGTSSNTTMSHGEVLKAFVEHARKLLGNGCPVLVACPEKSALGTDTRAYGANPLTFHASFAAPQLAISAALDDESSQSEMQARLTQITARIKVMSAEEQPVLSPILQTADTSAETLKQGIAACEAAHIPHRNIIAMQGPFSLGLNIALMEQFSIRFLVTKDGGAAGGFAEKVQAAQTAGAQLVVLRRPPETGETEDELFTYCQEKLQWSH